VTADRVIEAFKEAPKFEFIASNLSNKQAEKPKAAFAIWAAGATPSGDGLPPGRLCSRCTPLRPHPMVTQEEIYRKASATLAGCRPCPLGDGTLRASVKSTCARKP
jgi:hypothetical protein